MTDREELLGDILSRIADQLNITDTMYEKAVSSYRAVGEWIGDGLGEYDVHIMPQGSMNLGTVVRPLSDKEDYDIDLVCLLAAGKGLSAREVKHKVGDRLKENKVYAEKLDPEGKRCWTMQYEEFHMDILPCVPFEDEYISPGHTAINLTNKDKNLGTYQFRPSDPSAYHDWFLDRARPYILLANKKVAARATEIKPVPVNTSRLKTPLQKAIQLLKRHRDVYFEKHPDLAPISIIITTLAAWACAHEENVYVALKTILNQMASHVELRGREYWVANPVMPAENFAEKWNAEPARRDAFVDWCAQARSDLIEVTNYVGLDELSSHYKKVLRPEPVDRAFKGLGDSVLNKRVVGGLYLSGLSTGLSTSAVAGKAVAAHSFYGT